MILDATDLAPDAILDTDVSIIGAGPAGITIALELARHGIDVVLLETGSAHNDPAAQTLSRAAEPGSNIHAPLDLAVRRQLGGTSNTWGGRCVPYDPIDLIDRTITSDSHWPVTYRELQSYFGRACDWLRCGRPVFSATQVPGLPTTLVPGLIDGNGILANDLERWSLPTNFGTEYRDDLKRSGQIRTVLGLTAIELVKATDSERIMSATCRALSGRRATIRARDFVIAAGGLESTRLLMNSTAPRGGQLGNHSDQLGRWYMAHLEGSIARIDLVTDAAQTVFGYERDIDGTYIRRRFTFSERFQIENDLPNIAGWFTNPELSDASHADGQLSITYLALMSPFGPIFAPDAQRLSLTGHHLPGTPYGHAHRSTSREHLANVLRDPREVLEYVLDFGVKRVLGRGRRPPGFFTHRADNSYPLQYHGEHLPASRSRVTLSDQRDALGVRRLDVDIRFADADIDGVIRAHAFWDAHLQRTGVGRLRYLHDDLGEAVRARSGGGFHQIGTTRMAARSEDGVLDKDLRVYGVDNVYVASSSALVTSGQANSMMMIITFAVRLADHLALQRQPATLR